MVILKSYFRFPNIFILSLFLFIACNKDDSTETVDDDKPPSIEKIKLGEATTNSGESIVLWGNSQDFLTGYNDVYLSATDKEEREITDLDLSISPMLDFGGEILSCPTIKPTYNPESHLYEGAVFFTVAPVSSWNLGVRVGPQLLTFVTHVSESERKVIGIYTGTDEKEYVLSLMPHNPWEIGLNDFTIIIHRSINNQSFPVYDKFSIQVEPEMPSMGHGSKDNINPISKGNGLYTGKVNLTMGGEWKLNFVLSHDGEVIVDDAYVELSL